MNARVSRSPRRVVLLGLSAAAFWGFCTATGVAAPTPGGAVVAETAACRVLVTKVSYDDPGADDAEFIELRVERRGPPRPFHPGSEDAGDSPVSPTTVADASASPTLDAAIPAHDLTLGDCGLVSLELVNGGSGACEIYSTLPLSSVVVPEDDYVTFCATDSILAPARCDVMAAGRSALRNGWLQNGPSDGLRFRAEGGTSGLELSYEGRIGCFQASARELVDETGQMPGSPAPADPEADDVNAFCGDVAVLLPSTDAELRREAECPSRSTEVHADAAGAGDGSTVVASDRAGAVTAEGGADPGTTERVPSARPKVSTSIHAALGLDAGLVPIPRKPSSGPPEPPGCSTAPAGPARSGASASTLALVVAVTSFLQLRLRRRRRWVKRAQATDATSGGSDA